VDWPLVVIGIGTSLWIFGSQVTTSWSTMINGGLARGLTCSVSFWVGSSRIATLGNSRLRIGTAVMSRIIPAAAIADFRRDNGLQIASR
jgi:hypothetical protein